MTLYQRRRAVRPLPIGAVSQVTGIEIHTLRYWESEFDAFLKPIRTSGGQRRYTAEDIATVLDIKRLLRQEKYSIEGARQELSRMSEAGRADRQAA
jgi:DNA-binding transcriptional MerR regulator